MRRKDRERDRDFALQVIDTCEYGTVSMVLADGSPYSVVLSIVRDGDALYFHSAKIGQKTDGLRNNSKVCVSFVCDTFIPEKAFTTAYKSAVVFGTATEIEGDDVKTEILRTMCLKLVPNNMENFEEELHSSLAATSVWKISIDSITGKEKQWPK